MTGNKTDNGVLEQGTDEARISYSEDTPGQNVESFIKERERAFHEANERTKKHFSSVFGNPLQDYPYNDAIKIKPIKESFEELEMDEAKSSTGYDLYHKTFSGAMQHSYEYSKKKFGIEIDPNEIDDKVATGPAKPKTGKTNSYRLKGKGGKKGIQVQVYNTGKSFELNMYKEEVEELKMDEAKGLTKRIAGDSKFELLAVKSGLLKLSFVDVKDGDIYIGKEDFARFQKFVSKIKPAAVDKAHQEIIEQVELEEEGDNGLKAKAEKSGISLGILKQVYNRGLAAYKTGHRPGTSAPQWAFARVNSFITKGKGTWGGADKDLAAKVK